MLIEINKSKGSNYVITEEDREKEKKVLEFNSKFANEEEDFDEIKDPRQVCSCIFLFFETKQVLLNLFLMRFCLNKADC